MLPKILAMTIPENRIILHPIVLAAQTLCATGAAQDVCVLPIPGPTSSQDTPKFVVRGRFIASGP